MNAFNGVVNWQFLDEPLYRWFLFVGAALGILWSWEGIIGLMH